MSSSRLSISGNSSLLGENHQLGPAPLDPPSKRPKNAAEKIHLAIWQQKPRTIRKLIVDRNVDIESHNSFGQTPLFVAVYLLRYSCVKMLLKLGANANGRCVAGYTATHAAAYAGSIKILSLLLEYSGDLRLHDENHLTPIDWASEQSDVDKRIRVLNFIESARRCTMSQTGKEALQEKATSKGKNTLSQLLRKKLPVRGSESGEQEVDLGELIKNIHAMGFGKLYFGNGLKAAAISTVPYIDSKDLKCDRASLSYRSGSFAMMSSKMWHQTRVTVRSLLDPPPNGAIVDILISELEALCKLTHPQILLLMGVCQTRNYEGLLLVFEHVSLGSLYYCLHEKNCMPSMKNAIDILIQILDALIYLHTRNWLHCSITSHAVHLTGPNIAKLSSFEFAIENNEKNTGHKTFDLLGNKGWQSLYNWLCPEVLNGEAPSEKGDLYGMACVIWESCTGQVPWGNLDPDDIVVEVVNKQYMLPIDRKFLPKDIYNVLKYALQNDVSLRDIDLNELRTLLLHARKEIVKRDLPVYYKKDSITDSGLCLGSSKPQRSVSSSAIGKSTNTTKCQRKNDGMGIKSRAENYVSQQNLQDYDFVSNAAKRDFLLRSHHIRDDFENENEEEEEEEENEEKEKKEKTSRRNNLNYFPSSHQNILSVSDQDLTYSSESPSLSPYHSGEDDSLFSEDVVDDVGPSRSLKKTTEVPKSSSAAAFVAAHLQESNRKGYGRTFSHNTINHTNIQNNVHPNNNNATTTTTTTNTNNTNTDKKISVNCSIKPASHSTQRTKEEPLEVVPNQIPVLASSTHKTESLETAEIKSTLSKVRQIYQSQEYGTRIPVTCRDVQSLPLSPSPYSVTKKGDSVPKIKPRTFLRTPVLPNPSSSVFKPKTFIGPYASLEDKKGVRENGNVIKARDRVNSPPRSEWSTRGVQNLIQNLESLVRRGSFPLNGTIYNTVLMNSKSTSNRRFSDSITSTQINPVLCHCKETEENCFPSPPREEDRWSSLRGKKDSPPIPLPKPAPRSVSNSSNDNKSFIEEKNNNIHESFTTSTPNESRVKRNHLRKSYALSMSEAVDQGVDLWTTVSQQPPSTDIKKSNLKQHQNSNNHITHNNNNNKYNNNNNTITTQNVTFNTKVEEMYQIERNHFWYPHHRSTTEDTEDMYCDDELHPSIENAPNIQLSNSQELIEIHGRNEYPNTISLLGADTDSILSMDNPSTGPTSLLSEVSLEKDVYSSLSNENSYPNFYYSLENISSLQQQQTNKWTTHDNTNTNNNDDEFRGQEVNK